MSKPKKHFQIQRMFGLAKSKAEHAWMGTKEYLEQTAGKRLSELTFDEANAVIVALGGDAFAAYGGSKRNENYKKQSAGIKTVETPVHVEFIRKLAAKRSMTESGIASMASRMHLPWPPNTTEQGNKIAEALKAMNARDAKGTQGTSPHASKGVSSAASLSEPRFRRVA